MLIDCKICIEYIAGPLIQIALDRVIYPGKDCIGKSFAHEVLQVDSSKHIREHLERVFPPKLIPKQQQFGKIAAQNDVSFDSILAEDS